MNNSELSYKLKYILKELGLNKKELLDECRKYNPSLSKPTLLNAINGKNKNTPSIDTLSAIVNVCKMSGNARLKYISFDYLLNENIQDVQANNISVYQEIGLSDFVIDKLKLYNSPALQDKIKTINYFLYNTQGIYWQYLDMLKRTYEIKVNIDNIDLILKLFNNNMYLFYLSNYFKNIYDIYKKLNEKDKKIDLKNLDELLDILIVNLKYELNKIMESTYESMKPIKEVDKMKPIKINSYRNLDKIKDKNEFIIDISEVPVKQRVKVIDILEGLTLVNGSLKKISADTYEVIINKN